MIGAAEKPDVRDTLPRIEFQIEPLGHNPLVPTAPMLFKQEGRDLVVEWLPESDQGRTLPPDEILDQVIERSRKDVQRYPRSSRARTNLGLALLSAGRTDEATGLFQEALQLGSDNYVAASSLGKALVKRGRYDEAEQLYRTLAQNFPEAITPLMSLAHLAIRRDDPTAAERIIRGVIRTGTKSPVPHYQLATLLIRLGKATEAVKELRTALKSDVRSPSLYQALGVAYALAGDNAKSSRAFKSALNLAPSLGDAVRGLANTLLNVGNADATIEVLAAYLEENSQDAQARVSLGRAYTQKGRHGLARSQFTQALQLVEGNKRLSSLRYQLANDIGVSFYYERDLKQAERWFRQSIAFEPRGESLPYKNLAWILVEFEKYQEAQDVLSRCKALFGEEKEVSVLLASMYGELGQYDKAISELTPLLTRDDCDAGVFASLGAYLADGRHDFLGSRDVLRQGLEKFPNDKLIVNNLAYSCLMMDKLDEARELLKNHCPNPGSDVLLNATWGLLYLKEGNKKEARALYGEAARLASLAGNRRLAETVKQKMHLEFANDLFRSGDMLGALKEINSGLRSGKGRLAYANDLLLTKLNIEQRIPDIRDGPDKSR
jgi:Flp pilus assembly protein TadD